MLKQKFVILIALVAISLLPILTTNANAFDGQCIASVETDPGILLLHKLALALQLDSVGCEQYSDDLTAKLVECMKNVCALEDPQRCVGTYEIAQEIFDRFCTEDYQLRGE